MVFNSLERKSVINREKLIMNQYTLSLMEEALRKGVIDKKLVDSIEAQVVFILRDLIQRYTKGKSTSLAIERAEKILGSIYYCIDAYIKSFNTPEESIEILKNESVKEIYEKGNEIIAECVIEAMMLYNDVKENKIDVPSEVYNDTINKGIPPFFKKYDMVFNAQEGDGSIDYPLVFDDMNIGGVFYIKNYLENLGIETEYCNFFNKEDIKNLLINYGRIYKIDYAKSPINFFELLFNNSIFTVLLGNSLDNIVLSKFQESILINMFQSLTSEEISGFICRAAEKIIIDKNIVHSKLAEYIHMYIPIITERILNAVKNDSVSNIIVTSDEESFEDINIIFDKGRKMKNEEFRTIIDEITDCESIQDKLRIINESIKSIEDFIDVLKANCLFGDEMKTVFGTLSDIELSVLGKVVFSEERRNGEINLNEVSMNIKEEEWQQQFAAFLKGLGDGRISSIEKYINTVEL